MNPLEEIERAAKRKRDWLRANGRGELAECYRTRDWWIHRRMVEALEAADDRAVDHLLRLAGVQL